MPDHSPTPPTRTSDQRMQALNQANNIRAQRAQDKKMLKKRQLDPRAILENPPAHWEHAKIADLLKAIPGIGDTKVTKILLHKRISASRTLGGMTKDQIQRLKDSIDRYCPQR